VLIKQRFPTFYNGMGVPEKMENVLVFEDSINGVRSALAAGCTVSYIYSGVIYTIIINFD
jgi:beta-phosphoglucomutase-like phosphatase (HAD superfamily)